MAGERIERDALGERRLPGDALYGISALRASENFSLAGRPVHPALIRAYGAVKLACARTNRSVGLWKDSAAKAEAIERACGELMEGLHVDQIVVDSLQGGAGTSTNMNVNEVIANRALQLLGHTPGQYEIVSPHDDINAHQSTNDTFPTALRVAAIAQLRRLETELISLQESFQRKEKEFAHIVKIGRTELQDAVLITLGRELSAWAEVTNRDRWRVYKCEERLRVVNLGGTAVGTGLGAPRRYIFRVVDSLKEITGLGLARSENMIDITQNADVFVEVSGILKACAASLLKISNDLRLLASGPTGGFGELHLPALQEGSTIMPGKVNPVIPEAVAQAAMLVFGHDSVIANAAAGGNLELNQYLPLIAHSLLESLDLLTRAVAILRERCIDGLAANEERCAQAVASATAAVTALVGPLGYDTAAAVAAESQHTGKSIKDVAVARGLVTSEQFDQLVSAEAVCRLGSREERSEN